MKELHRKDPASHPGPESCEAERKVRSEALTGEDAGEVLSYEIRSPVLPTLLSEAEGNNPRLDTGRSQPPAQQDGGLQRAAKIARSKAAMNGVGRSEQAIVCAGQYSVQEG
jgi:hypothetical protein